VRGAFAAFLLGLLSGALPVHAESLPLDAGVINVRDYGAGGDGRHDDTKALLTAIAAGGGDTGRAFWQDRIVYLPNGTYLVSAPLVKRYAGGRFASGMILVGQSRNGTILRLKDHAPGFDDPRHPRAVVFTTSKLLDGTPTSGGKNYPALGEGNDAYMNSVEDLTIEVGKGNPGAIGIDYLANNVGAIRNVTLKAPAGSGAIGLSIQRKWPGPALIQNLVVEGFAMGIAVAQTEYGLTFDHIRLRGQRGAALRNDQNVLSMHDLDITDPAPAIVNSGAKGFIAIDGGSIALTTGAPKLVSAITNAGIVVIRGLTLARADRESKQSEKAATLNGVLATGGAWKPMAWPAWLPRLRDAPADPPVAPKSWANAAHFGAVPNPTHDSAQALRRAFASGASVVYLPHGIYAISRAIEIPPSVRRIVGMNSTLKVFLPRRPDFARDQGMLRILGNGAPLSIENLAFDNTNLGHQLGIEVAGPRTVTIRDVVAAGVALLDRRQAGGPVFLEDVCCGAIELDGPASVIARQLDTEGGGVRILDRGSPLSILGLKTEGIATVLDNRHGAHADVWGGLVYMVHNDGGTRVPAFRNADAWLLAAFAEESLRAASHYNVYLAVQTPEGEAVLTPDRFPARGFGRFVPDLRATPAGSRPQ
jgi:Pectate lyase superfamily protein